MAYSTYSDDERSRWDPRGWRKRVWVMLGLGLVVVIVVAVVAGVLVSQDQQRRNRYPDYSKRTYALSDTYSGENFFDKFNYFTGYDPAGGLVHYVPREQAQQLNLTYASSNTAILRVDTSVGPGSEPDASTGRFSVRVESKVQYNSGLFVFDIRHTPYGCATWPALWFADRFHWPDNGEIDVMEAVNQATDGNHMTLHTTAGCNMDVRRQQSGTSLQGDCLNSTNDNLGCAVQGSRATYGQAFNDAGGGVMAMEWRHEGIRMWQFGRNAVPADISNRAPDPSAWGTALADFPNTNCDIGSYIKNQSLIINIDVCGHWVYAVYGNSGCPDDCPTFQANNPKAFESAYWEFGRFDVYQPV